MGGGRVSKKKFQLKIVAFPGGGRASPDSGVSSRSVTPDDEEDYQMDDGPVVLDDRQHEIEMSDEDEGLDEEDDGDDEWNGESKGWTAPKRKMKNTARNSM